MDENELSCKEHLNCKVLHITASPEGMPSTINEPV